MPYDRLWQRIGKLTLGLLAFNLASHVMMPGLNFSVFLRYVRNAPGGPFCGFTTGWAAAACRG